eukprot:TRINITY_DN12791_c0_g1_i1.p1 TRINITY_DN12791_c0_g1~~TRINITY_DN12791_c0_g1_i1.p1  ORF type:complete len:108 (+),score=21.30 TRINITY_DN12791_c0_g1_i1:156-479(+)
MDNKPTRTLVDSKGDDNDTKLEGNVLYKSERNERGDNTFVKKLKMNNFNFFNLLGKGSYGAVFSAQYNGDNCQPICAVKILYNYHNMTEEELLKNAENEQNTDGWYS